MDEPSPPADDREKKNRRAVRRSVGKAIDIASMLGDVADPAARLMIDMPLESGKGQVHLALTDGGRRTSVWAPTLQDAMKLLIAKSSAP
jgi:hypothetical protein